MNEQGTSTEAHILRDMLEELKYKPIKSSKKVTKGLSKVTKPLSNMIAKMTVSGAKNLEE